jgi:hypothetical protein
MSKTWNRGGVAALAALISFSSITLPSRTAKAEVGVLEATLIGAGVGAVIGLVYALATSGDGKDKDKDKDKDSDEGRKEAGAARNAQLQRFLVPTPSTSESRNRHAAVGGLVIRF